MLKCWAATTHDRPTFEDISETMQASYSAALDSKPTVRRATANVYDVEAESEETNDAIQSLRLHAVAEEVDGYVSEASLLTPANNSVSLQNAAPGLVPASGDCSKYLPMCYLPMQSLQSQGSLRPRSNDISFGERHPEASTSTTAFYTDMSAGLEVILEQDGNQYVAYDYGLSQVDRLNGNAGTMNPLYRSASRSSFGSCKSRSSDV
jgi:hypothetical protein